MPAISRWMIRFALFYVVTGIIIGAILLTHKAYPSYPSVWLFLPIHIEITIVGWIVQFTVGTGYWMLPRFLKGPPRGSSNLGWVMVICLNIGIGCIIIHPLTSTVVCLLCCTGTGLPAIAQRRRK